jgi:catechol 2,3-dioxygenase-like lactoylglutathione lyase family enzyme
MLDQAPVTTMLPVIDLHRARHFYETMLGLRPLGIYNRGHGHQETPT